MHIHSHTAMLVNMHSNMHANNQANTVVSEIPVNENAVHANNANMSPWLLHVYLSCPQQINIEKEEAYVSWDFLCLIVSKKTSNNAAGVTMLDWENSLVWDQDNQYDLALWQYSFVQHHFADKQASEFHETQKPPLLNMGIVDCCEMFSMQDLEYQFIYKGQFATHRLYLQSCLWPVINYLQRH